MTEPKSPTDTVRPLSGARILALEQMPTLPYATQLGAERQAELRSGGVIG